MRSTREPLEQLRVVRLRIRRGAKDLGRVLALGWLAEPEGIQQWPEVWARALRATFPDEASELAANAGMGLVDLLADDTALEEALHAVNIGLLAGLGANMESLRTVARQVLVFAVEALARF